MIADESFGFTGDSLEMQCPPSIFAPEAEASVKSRKVDIEINREVEEITKGISLTAVTDAEETARFIQEKVELEDQITRLSRQRDEALCSQERVKMEDKERRLGEVKRGIQDELERSEEYRGWLVGLRELISLQRGSSGLQSRV
jgi:hypothetical protein